MNNTRFINKRQLLSAQDSIPGSVCYFVGAKKKQRTCHPKVVLLAEMLEDVKLAEENRHFNGETLNVNHMCQCGEGLSF